MMYKVYIKNRTTGTVSEFLFEDYEHASSYVNKLIKTKRNVHELETTGISIMVMQ